MSLRWLVVLTLVSFLHLAFTNPIDDVDADSENNVNTHPIDTTYYYRLTNAYSGRHLALDVENDGQNYALKMTQISDHSGQFWRFNPVGNNAYKLQTLFLKHRYSLDIVNDGINNKPHMTMTGSYSGQSWHLIPQDDGTFKLSNEFSGNDKFLDVYNNNRVAFMGTNDKDYSGQHWTFHKIGPIKDH